MRPSRPTISDGIANLPRRLVLIAAAAASLPAMAAAAEPTTRRTDFLPYGTESFHIPPAIERIDVPPRAIELLTSAIRTQTGPNRSLYVTSLGACGPAGLPPLRPLLHDVDPTIRADAVRAIGAIGSTDAAADVRPLLGDPDADVRREAALALPKLGDAAALTPALRDVNPAVRAAGFEGASTPKDLSIVIGLLPTLDSTEQPSAVEAVGRAGRAADGGALLMLIDSSYPAVRAAVVRAIGHLRTPAGREAIVAAIHDSSPSVRREALHALGGLTSVSQTQSAALAALKDADPTVREAGADVLASAPTAAAVHALTQQLNDRYGPAHLAARRALMALGDASLATGQMLLDNAEAPRRVDGLYLLSTRPEPIRLDRRIELLRDPEYSVVAAAANSLTPVRPPADRISDDLIAIVNASRSQQSPSPDMTRAETAAILLAGTCGCRSIVPLLERLIPVRYGELEAPDDVRHAAMWAVGVLASANSSAAAVVRAVPEGALTDSGDTFESIKASINMQDTTILRLVRDWNSKKSLNGSNETRWIAHEAYDTLSGVTTIYSPLVMPLVPELPIHDLK